MRKIFDRPNHEIHRWPLITGHSEIPMVNLCNGNDGPPCPPSSLQEVDPKIHVSQFCRRCRCRILTHDSPTRPQPKSEMMKHVPQSTASQSQNDQPAPKKVTPYFLVDPDRVAEIACHQVKEKFKTCQLGADEMQAYIAQCAAVNGRMANFGRISTHGPKAVSDRTTLSIRHATAALNHLVEAGFLVPQNNLEHPSLPALVKATFEVDSKHSGSLAVSQALLQCQLDKKRAILGTLRHLMQYLDATPGIPLSVARMDAIQLYLALLAEQDFARYAGVDPALVGEICPRDACSEMDLLRLAPGCAGFELMAVKVPERTAFHPEFARQAVSHVPPSEDMASSEDRFKLALKNLKRSALIYDTFVLWDGDPTAADSPAYEPSIIGTLHVGPLRDKNLEEHLDEAMEKFVRDLLVESGTEYGRNNWRVYERGAPVLRAVIPQHQMARACIIKQIRVRHWAYDANNLGSLEIDRARVQGQVSRLMEIRRRILDQLYPSEAA